MGCRDLEDLISGLLFVKATLQEINGGGGTTLSDMEKLADIYRDLYSVSIRVIREAEAIRAKGYDVMGDNQLKAVAREIASYLARIDDISRSARALVLGEGRELSEVIDELSRGAVAESN